jgi:L-threonylcarbamoyladenylate synthase
VPARLLAIDDADARRRAADALGRGSLVAFATETVYGLGADATDETAVARIFQAKGRPRFNPLISHVADAEAALALLETDPRVEALAARWWPGPLTLVLRRRADCPVAWLACAGLETIAVRVPAPAATRALLAEFGRPVAAPSANRSGRVSPTTAAHVLEAFADSVDLVLDGGPCTVGLESSVVDLCGPRPRLLRPGAVTREDLEALLGPIEVAAAGDAVAAPGMLASHYAPRARVRLDARAPEEGEVFLDFGATRADADADLSPDGDLLEAASRLFALLRELDRDGVAGIAVAPVPDRGLGTAIRDRLARAAAPREQSR